MGGSCPFGPFGPFGFSLFSLTVHELEDQRHVVAEGVLVEVALEVCREDSDLLVEELENHRRVNVAACHRHQVKVEVSRVEEGVAIQLKLEKISK